MKSEGRYNDYNTPRLTDGGKETIQEFLTQKKQFSKNPKTHREKVTQQSFSPIFSFLTLTDS